MNTRALPERYELNDEQGSILFFVLAMIVVISGVVYYYFNPYRVTADDFIASSVRTESVMQAYGIEKTLSGIIPRMDMNIYRAFHKLPLWSPVSINIPKNKGMLTVKIMSMNNCINISGLERVTLTGKTNRLTQVLNHLSEHLLGARNEGGKLISVLTIPESRESDIAESYRNKRYLSAQQRVLRARVAPFLCRQVSTEQRININAIGPQQFPVLLAILPEGITEKKLLTIWKKKGNVPWNSTEEFLHAISPTALVSSSLKDELLVSDEEIQLTLSYSNKRGDDFYMSDKFFLVGNSMKLLSRHLFRDDDIR